MTAVLGVARAGPLGEWQPPQRGGGSAAGAAHETVGEPLAGRSARSGADPRPSGPLAVLPAATAAPDRAAERDAWAILASVDGIGPMTLGALLRALGDGRGVLATAGAPRGAGRLVEAAASEGIRLEAAVAGAVVAAAGRGAEILATVRESGLVVVTVEDPAYPARLRAIELPPPVLFVLGTPAALDPARAVAVVGTRRPTDGGRRLGGAIAAALAGAGATVVSGLAIGVDGVAHAAALAAGGQTVAVLGGGHARLYPRAHARLAEAIAAEGGAVVSELPPEASPCPGTFPRRNRVISGLADATVVVEAGERSGALITAHWALEQGRGCFLVPGPIDAPRSVGCNRFLREYPGEARLVAGIAELVEDLELAEPARPGGAASSSREAGDAGSAAGTGPGASLFASPAASRRPYPRSFAAGARPTTVAAVLGQSERQVASALARGGTTADVLAATTDLAVPTILAVLTRLEEAGVVVGAFGRYRLTDALDRFTADGPPGGRTQR